MAITNNKNNLACDEQLVAANGAAVATAEEKESAAGAGVANVSVKVSSTSSKRVR